MTTKKHLRELGFIYKSKYVAELCVNGCMFTLSRYFITSCNKKGILRTLDVREGYWNIKWFIEDIINPPTPVARHAPIELEPLPESHYDENGNWCFYMRMCMTPISLSNETAVYTFHVCKE